MRRRLGDAAVQIVLLTATLAAGGQARAAGPENFNGDPKHGADLVRSYGCGGCHDIPGIQNANGNVGPPLDRIGTRTYIAGYLHNSPENMASWIEDPQRVLPGNAMPRMGIKPNEARDIAAFLYTLK